MVELFVKKLILSPILDTLTFFQSFHAWSNFMKFIIYRYDELSNRFEINQTKSLYDK